MVKNKGKKRWESIPQEGVAIPCPWHHHGIQHPTGAPPCFKDPSVIGGDQQINMGALIFWITMMASESAPALIKMGDHIRLLEVKLDHVRQTLGITDG